MRVLPLCLLVLSVVFAALQGGVSAQDAPGPDEADEQERVEPAERARRAHRLREFGYPMLAREQLDIALRQDPANHAALLEYVRLYTRAGADPTEIEPYVASLLDIYPKDYEACFEIALWLYTIGDQPDAPDPEDDEQLALALDRLKAEMHVYQALGAYIIKPAPELPKEAEGRPALPLAFLARCAAQRPDSTEVAEFAAGYLDLVGRRFQTWAETDGGLAPFGQAARILYGMALELYRRAERDERFTADVRTRMASLLYRMGRFDEARTQATLAYQLLPNSLRVADTMRDLAEATGDFDLLRDALVRMDRVFRDETSRLDLSALDRVHERGWPMARWLEYREVQRMPLHDRGRFLALLLEKHPDFLELRYLEAHQRLELAFHAVRHDDGTMLLRNALHALDACKELGETLPDWHGLRAACLWELGRFKEAAESYERLARMDPEDSEASRHARAAREIGEGLYSRMDYQIYRRALEPGDLREKLTTLREVTGRAPRFWGAQLLLGRVAFMLTNFETAYEAYTAALKEIPENYECLDGAAHSALRTNRYERSAELFQRLHELEPNYRDSQRWLGIAQWAVGAGEDERRGMRAWMEAANASMSATDRRRLLENAARLAPRFPEPLLELASLERQRGEFGAAESLLERAGEYARDHFVRAAVHRERGRVFLATRRLERAIAEFGSAFDAYPDDGTDLMLAALAYQQAGDHGGAALAMRRLFADLPGSPLLRPRPSDLHQLDLIPVDSGPVKRVSPEYDVGDRLRFDVKIEVHGEGRGQPSRALSLGFTMRVEILETPRHGGLYRLAVSFSDAPSAEWAALDQLSFNLEVSPWFGMTRPPVIGAFENVIHPALQALVEGLTAGMGDAPIAAPYVWQNLFTQGPPRFGDDAIEASALVETLGDNKVIVRRSLAGRRLGDQGAADSTFGRGLEARVEIGGARRALRTVSFEIGKQELTPERDDVIRTRLKVELRAR